MTGPPHRPVTSHAPLWWAVAATCLSLVPTATVLALAQPASAAVSTKPGPALSRFALTTTGAPLVASGTIAAGGGLLLTDQGAATVTGRLDNSPSTQAMAVAVEPGQTLRSLSASNGGPTAPGASAQYPGGPTTSADTTVGSTAATATAHTASATARADSTDHAATATETLSTNTQGDVLAAGVTSRSGAVTIAGIMTIGNVVGTAGVGYDDKGHHAAAGVSVTSASIAGQPVSIDSTGVHALGTAVLPVPGGGLPAPVASILAKAGVSISFLQPVMSTTTTSALADSGALVIHETTPDLTSGITTVSSATDITLYLGRAQATLSDAATGPSTDVISPPTASSPPPTMTSAPPEGIGTGPSGHMPSGSWPGPSIAPVASPRRLLGHQIGAVTAFAALATWQLLTLGIVTLAAINARQRRISPQLCPCPPAAVSG
ncbi:MAG: hypothetical protein QOG99_1450 [Frankiales bacterium]|nr:hypothetical protein [Frankiales bacterium]